MLLLEKIASIQIDVDAARELLLDIPCWLDFSMFKVYAAKYKNFEVNSKNDLHHLFSQLSRDCFNIEKLAVTPRTEKDCLHHALTMIPTALCAIDLYSKFSESYLKLNFDYDFDPTNANRFGVNLYLARVHYAHSELPLIYNSNIEQAMGEVSEDLKIVLINNLHIFR